ncbi:hypothetical protein L1987_77722 [Smallanthus sonchifolius]|uniref:Uncharacterized protein n=1 Tax=Smallanthus sonchifolius TaxID=185202 RepID=A0ACB8ZAX7_9ASTR|nr:hypothetical protein L1987_77722 [Smallanthus sonchifolius]
MSSYLEAFIPISHPFDFVKNHNPIFQSRSHEEEHFSFNYPIMSQADVLYSCGSCGYPLNLASSNRITSEIGSKYRKSIKKGSISFESIDLSRFTQLDEPSCFPICLNYNASKTKLLCRQCGVQVGYGYADAHTMHDIESSTIPNSQYKQIVIKIQALQPLDTADQVDQLSTNDGR